MGDRSPTDQHGLVAALLVVAVIIGHVIARFTNGPRERVRANLTRFAICCILRIAVSTLFGVLIGWCFYALHYLIGGLMAVDVRFYFQWYAMFGGTIGFVVGLTWGLFGRSPVSEKGQADGG